MGQIQTTIAQCADLHKIGNAFYIGRNPTFKHNGRGWVKTPGIPFVRVMQTAADTFMALDDSCGRKAYAEV